jgi:ABC-2 type transport system permease protein
MTGQLRSELLKQRSTPTTILLVVTMTGLVALAIAMHVLTPAAESIATREYQLRVFEAGTNIGMLFAALLGAIAITAELRYGTIRPTFLVTPRRWPVVAAKLMVSAAAGFLLGLLAEGIMAAAATAAFTARDIAIQLDTGDYVQILGGGMVAAALWATIGVGVGALVRNQIGAVIGLCAWVLVVENLLLGFVPRLGAYTPSAAGLSLTGQTEGHLLSPAAAAILLVAYAIALSAVGLMATVRRDVA